MSSDFQFDPPKTAPQESIAPPLPEPPEPYLEPITLPHKLPIAPWRHAAALCLLLGFMVAIASVGAFVQGAKEGPVLPDNVSDLVLRSSEELLMFAALWGVAWLLSRASVDDLFLRWRGTWENVAMGVGYSIVLRFVPVVAVIFFAAFALIAGVKPENLMEFIKSLAPSPDRMVSSQAVQNDPIYRFLLATWMSFIVAGVREELWRVAVISSFTKLFSPRFSRQSVQILAVVISSLFFGMAHLVQGPLAVVLTALIGMVLGAITLAHRSVWPAIIAHGAFDALSFLLLPLASNMKTPFS